jgi:hypothetical protein
LMAEEDGGVLTKMWVKEMGSEIRVAQRASSWAIGRGVGVGLPAARAARLDASISSSCDAGLPRRAVVSPSEPRAGSTSVASVACRRGWGMGMSRVVVVIVVVNVVVGVEVVQCRQGRAEGDALGWCRWDPGQ